MNGKSCECDTRAVSAANVVSVVDVVSVVFVVLIDQGKKEKRKREVSLRRSAPCHQPHGQSDQMHGQRDINTMKERHRQPRPDRSTSPPAREDKRERGGFDRQKSGFAAENAETNRTVGRATTNHNTPHPRG